MLKDELLNQLSDAAIATEQAHSLLALLGDYFQYDNPDYATLKHRYRTYGGVRSAVYDIIRVQAVAFEKLFNRLEEEGISELPL